MPVQGLSSADASERRARHGANALPERPSAPLWRRVVRQFASPLICLLLAALAFDVTVWLVEGAHALPIDAIAIGAILVLNAWLGAYQEYRSESALARLKALAALQAWVIRDGRLTRVPAEAIVPGDVVRLEAGDRVPAAGRLVASQSVQIDESILMGESLPASPETGDEALSGTLVVRGTTCLAATRIGVRSAMGRPAAMLGDIETMDTPLERRVHVPGRQIARWVVGLAAVLAMAFVAAEGLPRATEALAFAVAQTVAAVPEGLPVLTAALALGVERMARRHAVVRRRSRRSGRSAPPKPLLHAAVAGGVLIQLGAAALPVTADLLGGAGLPLELWPLVFGASLMAWGMAELIVRIIWRLARQAARAASPVAVGP